MKWYIFKQTLGLRKIAVNKIPQGCFDSLILFLANYNLADIVEATNESLAVLCYHLNRSKGCLELKVLWASASVQCLLHRCQKQPGRSRLILNSALFLSKSEPSTGDRDILVTPALRIGSISHPSVFSLNLVILHHEIILLPIFCCHLHLWTSYHYSLPGCSEKTSV